MHPKNVIHTQQTTLIFTLCILSPTHSNPPPTPRNRKNLSKPHKRQRPLPTIPSHAFPKTPPHLWRMGVTFHARYLAPRSTPPEKEDNLAQGLGGGVRVQHPGSPKKAFAALSPGILVMGCIRHCAILESNAGTVSWDRFDFLLT